MHQARDEAEGSKELEEGIDFRKKTGDIRYETGAKKAIRSFVISPDSHRDS